MFSMVAIIFLVVAIGSPFISAICLTITRKPGY